MIFNHNLSEIERLTVPIIYVKDSNRVHKIGENHHDTLIVNENGSLDYYNLQNGCGTKNYYSFCDKEGNNLHLEDLIFPVPLLQFLDNLGYKVVKK